MTKFTQAVKDVLIYSVVIGIGVPVGNAVPPEKMVQALIVIGTVILTALIATLLVPFAAFSVNEKWQKLAVQYGAVPTFGTYAALLYHWAGIPAMLLVVPPLVVHAGYWQSSMHSRNYRLELYKLAFAEQMPHTTKLIALLSARRMQHVADEIISDLLADKTPDLTEAESIFGRGYLINCTRQEQERKEEWVA